jgi:hypothetical protein
MSRPRGTAIFAREASNDLGCVIFDALEFRRPHKLEGCVSARSFRSSAFASSGV